MTYLAEAAALDLEILAVIERWHVHGTSLDDRDFNDLALRIFAHQSRYNAPYARYARSFGYSHSALPESWERIPAVPAGAYKEATLATFDVRNAALAFVTSGTTAGVGGRHYMESRRLYDAALLGGFDRFMLAGRPRLRYLNVVPNPADRPQSSLGHMMARISADRGDENTGWYVRGDDLFIEAFFADLADAGARNHAVCIASTAFAMADILDAMRARNMRIALPFGSCIMETGGFKGRTRTVSRQELYADICGRFVCSPKTIIAEYGMTELTSQYYDVFPDNFREVLGSASAARFKSAPPWLRARAIGADGASLPGGTVGALVHVDLANRSSCVAVQTEDLGALYDEGLVLIGRDEGAALRGCSLDAAALVRR